MGPDWKTTNYFSLMRFVMAVSVLFSHSFHLSLGQGANDPLETVTPHMGFGSLGVFVFFFISGFLCPESVKKSSGFIRYILSKLKRLVPPLAIVTFFLALIAGPFLSSLEPAAYYASPQTYRYLLNSAFILVHELPGVFEHNIYNATVNGALWTMPIEFLCLLLGYMVWKLDIDLKNRQMILIPLSVTGVIVLWTLFPNTPTITPAISPCAMFFIGILYNIYHDRLPLKPLYAVLSGMLFMISCATPSRPLFLLTLYIALPYVLAFLGLGLRPRIKNTAGTKKTPAGILNIITDSRLPYCMYLCGFPIQQTLVMLSGGSMNPLHNFFLALPIDFLCGMLLCTIIEHIFVKR